MRVGPGRRITAGRRKRRRDAGIADLCGWYSGGSTDRAIAQADKTNQLERQPKEAQAAANTAERERDGPSGRSGGQRRLSKNQSRIKRQRQADSAPV